MSVASSVASKVVKPIATPSTTSTGSSIPSNAITYQNQPITYEGVYLTWK